MCWALYVGSDNPLPVSEPDAEGLHEQNAVYRDGDHRSWRDCENIVAAMPEARYFYSLGGCMCYLRYWDDAAIAAMKSEYAGYEEYLKGVNAFNPKIARILTQSLQRGQVWLLWAFNGDENKPELSHWTLSPSHFLDNQFDMPRERCVITIVPDGDPRAEPHIKEFPSFSDERAIRSRNLVYSNREDQPVMQREPVESSMLVSIGYDAETKTLEAEFHDGSVWQYGNVPEEEYKNLMRDNSKGGYMRDLIIGMYPEVRIRRKRR